MERLPRVQIADSISALSDEGKARKAIWWQGKEKPNLKQEHEGEGRAKKNKIKIPLPHSPPLLHPSSPPWLSLPHLSALLALTEPLSALICQHFLCVFLVSLSQIFGVIFCLYPPAAPPSPRSSHFCMFSLPPPPSINLLLRPSFALSQKSPGRQGMRFVFLPAPPHIVSLSTAPSS